LRSRIPELDGIEVNKLGVELYQFVSLYDDYKASLVQTVAGLVPRA